MTESCQGLVCMAVEESGREVGEVGAEGKGEGILGWEKSRRRDSEAQCGD